MVDDVHLAAIPNHAGESRAILSQSNPGTFDAYKLAAIQLNFFREPLLLCRGQIGDQALVRLEFKRKCFAERSN